MKAILSRSQTLVTLTILSVLILGSFVIVACLSRIDNYAPLSGEFHLTIWQAYELAMRPVISVGAYIFTPLGLILLAATRTNRRLLGFGLLSLIVGLVCATLLWIGPH